MEDTYKDLGERLRKEYAEIENDIVTGLMETDAEFSAPVSLYACPFFSAHPYPVS